MAAYIAGIYMLILSVLLGEVRMVDSGEFNIQKDSLTPPGKDFDENYRYSHLIQRMTNAAMLKRTRPHRRCQDGDVQTSLGAKNSHRCLENVNIRNTIHVKTFKQGHFQAGAPTKMKSPATLPSDFQKVLKNKVQKFPCPAGNRSCERRQDYKITYRCPFGLWCLKGENNEAATKQKKVRLIYDTSSLSRQEQGRSKVSRNPASYKNGVSRWRTKKDTTSVNGILRKARECPFGLWCLEDHNSNGKEKGDTDMKGKLESDHGHMKSKASDVKASKKLNQNQVEENCPIGLWCSTKRELGYESSLSLEKCPPGLWCKRKTIMIRKAAPPKRVNKNSGKEDCPSSFQCSLKREVSFEKVRHCPPGLWCKREEVKRENFKKSGVNKEFCPTGFKCSFKREAGYENSVTLQNCPPGLWCKKDMTVTKDDATELNGIAVFCPSGYVCSSKRLVNYENSETLDECPPGLWCKRSITVAGRNSKKHSKHCSPGPWGDLKLAVDNSAARRMFNDAECPPGLWCK